MMASQEIYDQINTHYGAEVARIRHEYATDIQTLLLIATLHEWARDLENPTRTQFTGITPWNRTRSSASVTPDHHD